MDGTAPNGVIVLGRHFRACTGRHGDVILFSESAVTRLAGECVAPAVSLLDGSRGLAEVVADRPVGVSADRMVRTLAAMMDAGIVVERKADPQVRDDGGYWDAAGLRGDAVSAARVRLIQVGAATGGATVARALTSAGMTVDDGPGCALTVVLCADYLDPELAGVEGELRSSRSYWLLAKPVGTQQWIGPFFGPDVSSCLRCLTRRMWRNRPAERLAGAACGLAPPAVRPAVATAATTAYGAHLVAHEAAKFLAGLRIAGQQAVWVLDTLTLESAHHPLPVDPHCPSCGRPPDPDTAPVVPHLTAVPVTGSPEGEYRTRPAVELLDALANLISPVTGLVPRLRREGDEGGEGHAFRSGPNLGGAEDLARLGSAMRRENGGAGGTAAAAQAAALCEALERHSGEFRGTEHRVRGSLRSLGEQAVDPRHCLLYSADQYADRQRWNAAHPPAYAVPEPFDPDQVIDWSLLWSLTAQRWRLLPTAMLYYGVPCPAARSLRADSNGCAAGSSLAEAILYGLLEVIERDAVACWWYGRREVPGADVPDDAPWLARARALHDRRGRELRLLDVTAACGVPVAVAVSRARGATEDIVFGFGAHLSMPAAARRALTESTQMLHMVKPAAGGGYVNGDPVATGWWRTATVATHPFLRPRPGPARRGAELATGDLREDVRLLCSALADTGGHDVLVLDQTRAEVGLPVAKVVVPGMRPLTPSFAAGRSGWAPRTTMPMFL